MGSVDDSYDNGLAESITGLYNDEVIARYKPWQHCKGVELGALEWVDGVTTGVCSILSGGYLRLDSRHRTTIHCLSW